MKILRLGTFELAVLIVVRALNGAAYGNLVRRALGHALGRRPSVGATYEAIYRLERKGLIHGRRVRARRPIVGGRAGHLYTITRAGREAITQCDRDWLALRRIIGPTLAPSHPEGTE